MYRDRNQTVRVTTDPVGESMTKQSLAAACDINNIMAKYKKTGLITHIREGATYQDLPGALEFHDAQNLIVEAVASFNGLSAAVRKRFGNDPSQLLAFISDENNLAEAISLGLVEEPEAAPAPPALPPEPPPAEPEAA